MDWRTVSVVVGTIATASVAHVLLRPINVSAASVAFAIAICSTAYLIGIFGKHWQVLARTRRELGLAVAIKLPWSGADEVVVNFAMGSLLRSLPSWLTLNGRLHAETLLSVVGALAGFSAQYAARARIAKGKVAPDQLSKEELAANGIIWVETKSGETLFYGDSINGFLVQEKTAEYPLWDLVAALGPEFGIKLAELPIRQEIFKHVTATVGGPEFGVLTVEEKNQPLIPLRQALEIYWPRAKWILEFSDGPGPAKGHSVDPENWPLVFAILAQAFIRMTRDVVDPRIGMRIVMESAVAMSKVDPKAIPQIWKDAPGRDHEEA